ncbi:MAG: DUF4173 domain-containing protein [Lachnospiraceae bacterium]|nr:DUF4173 domain-containing protein [Lachnospiraceae bacterium]
MSEVRVTSVAEDLSMQQVVAPQQVVTPQVVIAPKKEDTKETKSLKSNYGFFGPATLAYAALYAFCMFQNGSGITFPFFMVASLVFLCFTLSKLEITLKKGSIFYMISMMLLAVSTFCTDDWRIINLNKTGIFLLMMSLLLNQFYNTTQWKLGKYVGAICEMLIMVWGELGRPFTDGKAHYQEKGKANKKLWYGILGVVIAVPLLLIVAALLSAADAVFRQMTDNLIDLIKPGNIRNIVFRIACIFFASYGLTAFLCKRTIKEDVKDNKRGEPILAITITGLLTLIYLLFSGIQIFGLFLGKMQLPEGYTYAMYAREGFFQLLAVSILNLIIVLVCMSYFKESKILKAMLTLMSLCTFVMIASSCMRMIIYIRYYYMTFLRIFVLWSLVVLLLLFVGVVISIFKEKFPLFRYSVVVITVLYLALSFSHPDYIIAAVNVANAPISEAEERTIVEEQSYSEDFFSGPFFLGEYYTDYSYLSTLSADAAPVLLSYMDKLGYDMNVMKDADVLTSEIYQNAEADARGWKRSCFGYHYLDNVRVRLDKFSWRTFNISRYMMLRNIENRMEG